MMIIVVRECVLMKKTLVDDFRYFFWKLINILVYISSAHCSVLPNLVLVLILFFKLSFYWKCSTTIDFFDAITRQGYFCCSQILTVMMIMVLQECVLKKKTHMDDFTQFFWWLINISTSSTHCPVLQNLRLILFFKL